MGQHVIEQLDTGAVVGPQVYDPATGALIEGVRHGRTVTATWAGDDPDGQAALDAWAAHLVAHASSIDPTGDGLDTAPAAAGNPGKGDGSGGGRRK